MDNVKQEIESLKSVNRRIVATLVRLEGKMDDMAERMATKDDLAALRNEVNTRMDGFAGQLQDMKFRWAVNTDRLGGIDKRLENLEVHAEKVGAHLEKVDRRLDKIDRRLS